MEYCFFPNYKHLSAYNLFLDKGNIRPGIAMVLNMEQAAHCDCNVAEPDIVEDILFKDI